MTQNSSQASEVERRVLTGQSYILLRVLAGKCFEAWEFFRNSRVHQRYRGKLKAALLEVQDKLRRRLAQKGAAHLNRNLAFHYFPSQGNLAGCIAGAFEATPEAEPWLFYLSETMGNSFYFASELVMQRAMFKLPEPAGNAPFSIEHEVRETLDDVIDLSRNLSELLHSYLNVIVEKHFVDIKATPVAQFPAHHIKEAAIPFFLER